mmetsp:Transcript_27064/g.71339  ORF Transcript_27064/g.71339 Transcript_27064/m.71339 type:complete len:107 (+) Transcript_27064:1466-1786(+)
MSKSALLWKSGRLLEYIWAEILVSGGDGSVCDIIVFGATGSAAGTSGIPPSVGLGFESKPVSEAFNGCDALVGSIFVVEINSGGGGGRDELSDSGIVANARGGAIP